MIRTLESETEPQEQPALEGETTTSITPRIVSISRPQEEETRQRITQRTITVDRRQEREA